MEPEVKDDVTSDVINFLDELNAPEQKGDEGLDPEFDTSGDPEPDPVEPEPEPEGDPEPEPEPKLEPEPEPGSEPGTEEPEEPVDQTATLLARIEELEGQILTQPKAPAAPEPESKPDPATSEPDGEINFLGDQNVDDILDDPKKFNSLLNQVYQKGVSAASSGASENVLKSIPQLVVQYVQRHSKMAEDVGNFYKSNEDLSGVKKTVAAFANQVASEHADWDLPQVLEETGNRARKALGMKVKGGAIPPAGDKTKNPAKRAGLPGSKAVGKRPPSKPNMTGLAAEVGELLDM